MVTLIDSPISQKGTFVHIKRQDIFRTDEIVQRETKKGFMGWFV